MLRPSLAGLRAAVEDKQRELQELAERNLELRMRAALLSLMERQLREVAQHKRRLGLDDGDEQRQLEALRALAPGGDGGGGGGGEAGFGTAATLLGAADAGGARCGEGAEGAFLTHLLPGRSLLELESVTPEEVERVARMDYAEGVARGAQLCEEGQRLLGLHGPVGAQAPAPGTAPWSPEAGRQWGPRASRRPPLGPPPEWQRLREAAAAEGVRAQLAAIGRSIRRLSNLLAIHNPELYMQLSARNYRTGEVCVGMADLPHQVWDTAVLAPALRREQILMYMDANRLMQSRLARVHARRAAFSAQLQRRNAAAAAAAAQPAALFQPTAAQAIAPICAPAPGPWSPVAGAAAAGGSDSAGGGALANGASSYGLGACDLDAGDVEGLTEEELVYELAVNTACMRSIILSHTLLHHVLLADEQRAVAQSVVWPYPLNNKALLHSCRHCLVIHGGAAFPWARPPHADGGANGGSSLGGATDMRGGAGSSGSGSSGLVGWTAAAARPAAPAAGSSGSIGGRG